MENKSLILIDAHIHIHDCFNIEKFFNNAKNNFLRQLQLSNSNDHFAILCLTESHRINYFKQLSEKVGAYNKLNGWKVDLTSNENVIKLIDNKKFEIFLVAGRQIVTKENLEVLAIGLVEDPEDGQPIEEVINYTANQKSISVIPWGVGKWTGRRKEIVEKIILQSGTFPIYLGDNGNRPFFLKKSDFFDLALKNGILNIPGSDPLPFKNGENKPGSFGFMIDDALDIDKPFDNIYEKIKNSKNQFKTFGKLESFTNFLTNQISMQVIKRKRK